MSEELEVRNLVILHYYDDDDNPLEHEKRLKRPRGKKARKKLPVIIRFLGEISSLQEGLGEEETDIIGNAEMLEHFFTAPHEELFEYILQLEEDEKVFLESMQPLEVIEAVIEAANYLIDSAFNRPEVELALKKSDGDEPEVEKEVAEEQI